MSTTSDRRRVIQIPFGLLVILFGAVGLIVLNRISSSTDYQAGLDAIDELRASPNADFDPMEGLYGLETAFATVTATVSGFEGASVDLRSDGHITYDNDADGWPVVLLKDVSFGRALDVSDDYGELLAEFRRAAASGGLSLYNTAAFFEVGSSYTFFVGHWDSGEYSVLYAHDSDSDEPVIGFSSKETSQIIERLVAVADNGARLSRVDILTQLSLDLHEAALTDRPSSLVEAAIGRQVERPQTPLGDGLYPVIAEDISEKELASLVPIEVVVFPPATGGLEFALRGRKDLGWFTSGDGLSVIMFGYVAPGERLTLVSRRTDGSGAAAAVVGSADLEGGKIGVPNKFDVSFFGILDLTENAIATAGSLDRFREYASEDAYLAAVDQFDLLLDSSVEGSELDQRADE